MRDFTEHIISCGGIEVKEAVNNSNYLELEHRENSPKQNVNLKLNNFVTSVYKLDKRYKDLLLIAGYIFAADRKTSRGKPDNLEYHSWSRAFHFHINVRDYNFWNRPEIKELLEQALCFMSGDHSYKFTFYKAGSDFPTNIFDTEKFTIDKPENLIVSLFSGGIDSLSGAVDLLETTDAEICLVSHQSGLPGNLTIQRTLFEEINKLYPDRSKHYKFHCGLHKDKSRDETQRTRSFLYTSIAFAIAKTYGQNSIYVFENGITSINFAETQDLMNGRSSRTTHPQTLKKLENLFSAIAEDTFSIDNPFFFKTKTDVVEVLSKHNKLDLLDSSVSCSVSRKKEKDNTHCGVCSQCIDRRFAVFAAEVEMHDDNGIYHFDFLREDLEDDTLKKGLTEYIRLAHNFAKQDIDGWYEDRITEIIEIENYIKGLTEHERITKLYNLCQRHSGHIEKSIKRMRDIYDSPFSQSNDKSLFNLIIVSRTYQQETTKIKNEPINPLKEVPSKGLKQLVKETCENLITQKIITEALTETKKKRLLSSLIVADLKKHQYSITIKNENTISDYFRKLELQIKKEKSGKLIVVDNYKYVKK